MTRLSRIEIVPASPAHVGIIANRMRMHDVAECAALGRTPKAALRLGLKASSLCFTAKLDGKPEAMFGLVVENAIEGRGCPWMLGTEAIYDSGRALMVLGPQVLTLFSDSTPVMRNIVGVENTRAIRMLRRWGFNIHDEAQNGFVSFDMGA